jgi:hypothetical protein
MKTFYLIYIWNIIFILFITLGEDYLAVSYSIKTSGIEKSGRPGDERSRIHKSGVQKVRMQKVRIFTSGLFFFLTISANGY